MQLLQYTPACMQRTASKGCTHLLTSVLRLLCSVDGVHPLEQPIPPGITYIVPPRQAMQAHTGIHPATTIRFSEGGTDRAMHAQSALTRRDTATGGHGLGFGITPRGAQQGAAGAAAGSGSGAGQRPLSVKPAAGGGQQEESFGADLPAQWNDDVPGPGLGSLGNLLSASCTELWKRGGCKQGACLCGNAMFISQLVASYQNSCMVSN